MTVSLTPALSQGARWNRSALRAITMESPQGRFNLSRKDNRSAQGAGYSWTNHSSAVVFEAARRNASSADRGVEGEMG